MIEHDQSGPVEQNFAKYAGAITVLAVLLLVSIRITLESK